MAKMKKSEIQELVRNKAFEKLSVCEPFAQSLEVAKNTYAMKIEGEEIGIENKDFWVTIKLTVKQFEDTETKEAFDAETEAQLYQQEEKQKADEKAQKAVEKEKEKERKKKQKELDRLTKEKRKKEIEKELSETEPKAVAEDEIIKEVEGE